MRHSPDRGRIRAKPSWGLMERRNWQLSRDAFNALNNGSGLIEIKLVSAVDKKQAFDVLFNGVTLLRIERKKLPRGNKKLLKWVHSKGDLVSRKSQSSFQRISELHEQIRNEINKNIVKPNQTKDEFEDVSAHLARRREAIRKLEKELKVELLKADRIGYCERCRCFRQTGDLTAIGTTHVPCPFCNTNISMKTYHSLPSRSAQFISGSWFEEYVAKRLEKLGWTTFTDIYVYGNSGVKFEIDVLALKGGETLIVECKTGSVGLTRLSSFIAKFSQIRTTSAALISLLKLSADEHRVGEAVGKLRLIDDIHSEKALIKELKKLSV